MKTYLIKNSVKEQMDYYRRLLDLGALTQQEFQVLSDRLTATAEIETEKAHTRHVETRKRLAKRTLVYLMIIPVLCLLFVVFTVIPGFSALKTAKTQFRDGQYLDAMYSLRHMNGSSAALLRAIGVVDVEQQIEDWGFELMEAGQYEDAIFIFDTQQYGDHRQNAREKIDECEQAISERDYAAARALMEAGQYEEAAQAFAALKKYSDSQELLAQCQQAQEAAHLEEAYLAARALYDEGRYAEAYTAFSALRGYRDVDTLLSSDAHLLTSEKELAKQNAMTVGRTITFGRYEQDGNTGNGAEAISWVVLEYNEETGQSLLVSKYTLDQRAFHVTGNGKSQYPTWAESNLRNWLNDAFLNEAFTPEEQAAIVVTTVRTNVKEPDSQDKIWLLSYAEASTYYKTQTPRRATTLSGDAASWWLRTKGNDHSSADYVDVDGVVRSDATNQEKNVRPVLWLDLSKL